MFTAFTRARGFTLIEVLVTLLVLSIGLFGMLAVIVNSLKMNSSSVYRTIAAQQATALAETLRANPTAVGSTFVPVAGVTPYAFSSIAISAITPTTTLSCLQAAGCAGAAPLPRNEFILTSMDMWQKQLAAVLPSGTGTVCRDSTPNDGTSANWLCDGAANAPYVIKVCWNESRIAASNSASAVTGTGGTFGTGGALCTYTNL